MNQYSSSSPKSPPPDISTSSSATSGSSALAAATGAAAAAAAGAADPPPKEGTLVNPEAMISFKGFPSKEEITVFKVESSISASTDFKTALTSAAEILVFPDKANKA
eukprot:CAMPEP_0205849052 /NCGR_PEP_ID=MMETSP1019-20131125/1724_1 /ASSEMBLY_ACC=CAM_ASM_000403 /TAXON_ID=46462 /ORGANISM="Anophryoides haemophila, Strain AH6" /LENGTH=106 /DNA_ID=CAMNT_0053167323 /DNA_START=142 /DNA_END=462 /DNA_ORIENTATION=+